MPVKRSNKKRRFNSTTAIVITINNNNIKKVIANKPINNNDSPFLLNSFIRYNSPEGIKKKYTVNNNPLKIVRIYFAFSNSKANFKKALPNVLPFNKGIKLKYRAENTKKGSAALDMMYGIKTINASISRDRQIRIHETREPASKDLSSISSLDGSSIIARRPRAYPIHPPIVF